MCWGDTGAGAATTQANRQAAQYQNVAPYIQAAFQGGSGTLYSPVQPGSVYDPSQQYYAQNSQGGYMPYTTWNKPSSGGFFGSGIGADILGTATLGGAQGTAALTGIGSSGSPAPGALSTWNNLLKQGDLFTQSQYNLPGYSSDFYKGAQQDYVNYYMPQYAQQLANTQAQTMYSLANRGVLDSSVAKDTTSALNRAANTAQQGIISQGQGVSNQLQQQMGTQEASLLGQAASSVDPANAGKQAVSTAALYAQPNPMTPLTSSLFSAFQNAYLPAAYSQVGQSPQQGYMYSMPGQGSSDQTVIPGNQ